MHFDGIFALRDQKFYKNCDILIKYEKEVRYNVIQIFKLLVFRSLLLLKSLFLMEIFQTMFIKDKVTLIIMDAFDLHALGKFGLLYFSFIHVEAADFSII